MMHPSTRKMVPVIGCKRARSSAPARRDWAFSLRKVAVGCAPGPMIGPYHLRQGVWAKLCLRLAHPILPIRRSPLAAQLAKARPQGKWRQTATLQPNNATAKPRGRPANTPLTSLGAPIRPPFPSASRSGKTRLTRHPWSGKPPKGYRAAQSIPRWIISRGAPRSITSAWCPKAL